MDGGTDSSGCLACEMLGCWEEGEILRNTVWRLWFGAEIWGGTVCKPSPDAGWGHQWRDNGMDGVLDHWQTQEKGPDHPTWKIDIS
jgi:hypothetical protein